MRSSVCGSSTTSIESLAIAELLGVADQVRGYAGPPVDQRSALRAGEAQKRVARAPGTDLQELLAEHAARARRE